MRWSAGRLQRSGQRDRHHGRQHEHRTTETGNKQIDTLRIAFVPSREPEEIITATEPLKQMLTDELAKLGYDVGEVDITVGTSYEAVGEALSAGTADVGLIPGRHLCAL